MPHQLQLALIVAFAIVACSVCFQPGQAQSGDLDDNCTLTEFTTLSRKVAQVRHVQSTEFLHVAALRCGIPGQTRTCAPGLGDGCAANRLNPSTTAGAQVCSADTSAACPSKPCLPKNCRQACPSRAVHESSSLSAGFATQ